MVEGEESNHRVRKKRRNKIKERVRRGKRRVRKRRR